MDEKSNKVKLLVYATEDDRARINASNLLVYQDNTLYVHTYSYNYTIEIK